ncbi:MAG: 3-hydroxybutyryl-CoA dehydrogenase [Sphingobacteriales bacterium]|jgi:3-hydroxybutyryl-CoA dehydrogenase|nr:3-hydroxybutyryl-CoA dehydrogenase [Sphingobacteriales bacterium]
MQQITVIGAGTMGNGIAHLFAMNGYTVKLVDVNRDSLDRAVGTIAKNLDRMVTKGTISADEKAQTMSNLYTHDLLEQSEIEKSDLVIEAATENESIKLGIFYRLSQMCKPEAILATNTSSISITKIAASTNRPDKVIGMHFMNPVPLMKLVEIIRGYNTSNETAAKVVEACKRLGKIPVEANDYPGFVANRILMPMINEAICTLQEGVAGVAEIDTVMKLGMAHPMGPLQLADFIGLDVCLSILHVLHEGFGNPKYAPCPLLTNMVLAGKLGVKSGEGFYNYTHGTKDLVVANRFK